MIFWYSVKELKLKLSILSKFDLMKLNLSRGSKIETEFLTAMASEMNTHIISYVEHKMCLNHGFTLFVYPHTHCSKIRKTHMSTRMSTWTQIWSTSRWKNRSLTRTKWVFDRLWLSTHSSTWLNQLVGWVIGWLCQDRALVWVLHFGTHTQFDTYCVSSFSWVKCL